MKRLFSAALAVGLAFLVAGQSVAQTSVILRKPDNSGAQVDIGAQVSPFKPTGNTTLALTTTSARVALPSADTTVVVRNTGSVDAEISLGGSSVTATTSNFLLPAGSAVSLSAVGSTYIAGITVSGSTSLAISTGTGTPEFQAAAGTGGGGGGGVLSAGENHVGEVGGHTAIVGATFTTTATTTALADGQLLANSATAGSVTPLTFTGVCRVNQGTFAVRRARIKTTDNGFVGKSLWLYLYRDSPTVANGDHAAFSSTESNFIGRISVTFSLTFSDPLYKGIGAPDVGNEINGDCAAASTAVYGLLVANGPSGTLQGAKTIQPVLEVWDN